MVRAILASGDAQADAVSTRRRTRASKPKVRTGCITWIRRVKCGEEKPACLRCTSTGRTCDGYDKGAPSRHRIQDAIRGLEVARAEFLRAYQVNDALRSMRPIIADIDGTEIERRFFHGFRTASSSGLSNHVCNINDFFNRVCPQMSHQDEAVKHAIVALGSAYQLFQSPDDSAPPGLLREELEVFTVEQYTKSLSKLQKHAGSTSKESTHLFLVCCLAFICLESLRGNQEAAVTHLRNGLNILKSLSPSSFDFLSGVTWAPSPPNGEEAQLEEIIKMFGRLEISASFFAEDIVPIVSIRSYNIRRMNDGSDLREFEGLMDLHNAQCNFFRDVHGRMFETQAYWGDLAFWSRPEEQRQQHRLIERERRLDLLYKNFLASPRVPKAGTSEHFSLHVDVLHFRLAGLFLRGMTGLDPETYEVLCPQPTKGNQPILKEMLATVALLYQSGNRRSKAQKNKAFTYDAGVVGPLYFVAVSSSEASVRTKALKLLQDINTREGFWDGAELQKLIKVVGKAIEANKWPFAEVPRTLIGLGAIPGIYETLARLNISSEEEESACETK